MKKLAAMLSFAMLAGNAMAQAGGAARGVTGGTVAPGGFTAGTVAALAVAVAGIAAASSSSTTTPSNH